MSFDLLATPGIGRLLRWRHARLLLQVPLLLMSAAMIAHGLFGPQLAPRNLATLLGWVHYRGLLVLALLFAGNLFCMACPFMLPRAIARRLHLTHLHWPAALRNKWLAITLLVLVLFFYELFDLWASPFWTAWLALGYFIGAFAVDTLFRGASFCKWVCPIGQFNFVASTVSPLEIGVRKPAVCASCTTHDCITGREAQPARSAVAAIAAMPARPALAAQPAQPALRGCELGLYLPDKVGNLDCTLCLDCVHACPHDNVALTTRMPGEELWLEGPRPDIGRAGVGRPGERNDYAALAIVFTFGALLNAFGMVSPVYAVQAWIARSLGLKGEAPVLGILFFVLLVLVPVLLLGLAAWACRPALAVDRAPGSDGTHSASRAPDTGSARPGLLRIATRFCWGLVPLGFGTWLAHYGFHLLTGLWTFVPVTQRAVIDATGRALLGEPSWGLGGIRAGAIFPIEFGFLALGFMVSIGTLWRLAERESAPGRTARAAAPWIAVAVVLFLAALWLLQQPMEMRGTFLGGS